jgi:hypothetical protein
MESNEERDASETSKPTPTIKMVVNGDGGNGDGNMKKISKETTTPTLRTLDLMPVVVDLRRIQGTRRRRWSLPRLARQVVSGGARKTAGHRTCVFEKIRAKYLRN